MVKVALVGLLASGCTILGVGTGGLAGAQIGNGEHTGRDALTGGAIGAGVDRAVIAVYQFVARSNTVGGR